MALVVADRVKETTTSTGTGTINLAGAVTGFQTFVAGVGDTNTTYYAIIDPAGGTWEVGIGTVTDSTPDTLSRDTIIASSNSGSAVSFGAGNKNVFSTQPADKAVYLDSSGQLVIGGVAVTSTAAELNYVDGVTSNIQTQLDSKLNLSGGTMTGALTLSGAPTADNHATTKIYVDELIAAGIHYHDPVRVESPDSAGSLTATYDNGTSGVGATLTNNGTQAALVIDGVTLNTNDRVLIYNQTNAFENGIYTVTNTGSASTNWVLTRATDADSYGVDNQSLSEGTSIFVLEGTDGSGEVYACTTTGTITFGTTAINFSQIGKSAVITGNGGITVTGNQVSANVDATVQTTAANSVTSTASRTYALQVDSGNDLVVNVPWTDTTTNQTITLSGDASGSGTTSISVSLATDSVGSDEIAANAVSASELNVTGNGTTSQFLRSDGDGSFTWATPTDTNTTYSAGSGLSLTGTTFANTAPDQTVTLTGSGATTVTGTYPNFTISSTDTDTNTTYSTATASTLGLVKIGYTENGKNYPVELSSGQMYVNVPWTDTDTNTTYSAGTGLTLSGTTFSLSSTANADTVDNLHASSFIRNDTSNSVTNYANKVTFFSNTNAATTSGSQASLECYSSGAGNDAFMAFHVGGDYATYFGLDGDTNDLFVGGWSKGASRYKIWHAGNDGSGSGLDADTLDGAQPSVGASNSTIVQRHSSGYIFANYFNTTANDVSSGVTKVMVETGNDNYIRHGDAASIRTFINVENGATADQTASEILTAIKTVDGSGSGLDADNLDGYTWSSSGKDVRGTQVYADDWFRNYNSGEGLYNQATTQHWYSDDDDYWNIAGGTGANGIRFRDEHGGTVRGYVYANNSNQIGFLDSDGQWAIRHTRDSRTEFLINNTEYAEINTDYLTHTSDIRSPIFYDSNNTAYYADPASTSRFNAIEADGVHAADMGDYFTFYGDNSANHSISSRNNAGSADDDIRINSYGGVWINLDSNNNNTSGADFRIGRHGAAGSIAQLGLFDVYGDSLYAYSAYSFRSPIFYDSNNTGYYTNPASTSVMNTIDLEGTMRHNGDTNTYIQFHAADQFRVVTGGSERLEVNNSQITSTEPIHAPSFHGDGSALTNLPAGGMTLLGTWRFTSRTVSAGGTPNTINIPGVDTSKPLYVIVHAITATNVRGSTGMDVSTDNNYTGSGASYTLASGGSWTAHTSFAAQIAHGSGQTVAYRFASPSSTTAMKFGGGMCQIECWQ